MARAGIISGNHWPRAALAAGLAVAVAACGAPRPAAKAPPAESKPQAQATLVLSAGCPLGSTVQQGLNIADITCKPSPRTNPAGPVGIPNAP